MKNRIHLAALVLVLSAPPVFADSTQSNLNTEQAKQDYKVYLQQLKAVSKQYQQVVGEIKDVLKEEGVPTIDENTGALVMKPLDEATNPVTSGTFGDADIQETDKDIWVKIDLPGLRKDKIRVNIEDSKILKVAGERDVLVGTQTGQNIVSYKAERQRGSFERRIELPATVQEKGAEAKYENGVLSLRFPKASKKETSIRID